MMRVAVAGTNALALLIAHFIHKETSHQLVLLSRTVSRFPCCLLGWSSPFVETSSTLEVR